MECRLAGQFMGLGPQSQARLRRPTTVAGLVLSQALGDGRAQVEQRNRRSGSPAGQKRSCGSWDGS